jgi:hypothetical protein
VLAKSKDIEELKVSLKEFLGKEWNRKGGSNVCHNLLASETHFWNCSDKLTTGNSRPKSICSWGNSLWDHSVPNLCHV